MKENKMEEKKIKREEKPKKKLKNKQGITLIALVITIVVLLILAGVSIAMLTGNNGILTQAQNAKNETEEAEDIEKIKLAVSEAQISESGYQKLEMVNFQEALNKQFEGRNLELLDNGDGSFIIKLDNMSKSFYADNNGKIISNENILKISTAEELKKFRDDVNNGNTYENWYVYLENDITLDINEQWKPIGLYPMDSSSPTGESNNPFSGIFDGHNYEINGIYINTTDKVQGLFGLVNNGTIKNIGLEENNYISGGVATAGLVGYLYNGGSVINCYNKSDITSTGKSLTAGIVGQASKNTLITQCYNSGSINSSGNYIGGICGNVDANSIVEKCYNIGVVNTSGDYIGGICGNLREKANIQECYNSGQIIGKNSYVGGICGENFQDTIIQNCYNAGEITGQNENVGGITGNTGGKISNCYNVGNIIGKTKIGGITGEAYKSTSITQNSGIISNTYSLEGITTNICGFKGINVIIENSSIKSEEEMKRLATILGKSFCDNANGYPMLNWQ